MWSFALLGALLLLFPGFCCLAGFVYASRSPQLYLSAIPELPAQSATSLAFIIGGALSAHVVGTGIFVLQELVCASAHACWTTSFNPNLYIALLTNEYADRAGSFAIFYVLIWLTCLGIVTGAVSALVARTTTVQNLMRPTFAYWLFNVIRDAEDLNQVVIAHVLTTLGNNGVYAGYTGAVESIRLDTTGEITSITLSAVDRFSVLVSPSGVHRRTTPSTPMSFFHVTKDDISNLNFEVIRLEGHELKDIEDESASQETGTFRKLANWFLGTKF